MKMKIILAVTILIVLTTTTIVLIITFAGKPVESEEDTIEIADDIMRFVIYPSGRVGDTYCFTLNEEKCLKCTAGTMKNLNIEKAISWTNIVNSSEKLLTEQEIQKLLNLANELASSNYEELVVKSNSWYVVYLYKGELYKMHWGINNSEIFNELGETLIELSPIPIVGPK